MQTEYDAIVIGGGSAGVSFARHAADTGASILLIERAELGGTCVNRGCVPKKLLWTVADTLWRSAALTRSGVLDATPKVDMERLCAMRGDKLQQIRDSYGDKLDKAGVTVIASDAELTAPGEVSVVGTKVHAPRIVLATGGHPVRPDIPGIEMASDSDEVLGWTALPRSIVVIGGGYIGCEMAAIHAALGCRVTLVTDTDRVLVEFSEAAAKVGQANLQAQGVRIVTNCAPESLQRHDDELELVLCDADPVRAEKVIVATGRAPSLTALGALKDRVTLTDRGVVGIDDRFETSVPGLHAIGDCADRLPLTPVATADGETLAAQLFGIHRAPVDLAHVATTAFVLPPLAEVGQPKPQDIFDDAAVAPLSATLRGDSVQHYWGLGGSASGLTAVSLVADGAHEAIGWAAETVLARPSRDRMRDALGVHPSTVEEALG